jgi:hypothetical protein
MSVEAKSIPVCTSVVHDPHRKTENRQLLSQPSDIGNLTAASIETFSIHQERGMRNSPEIVR